MKKCVKNARWCSHNIKITQIKELKESLCKELIILTPNQANENSVDFTIVHF